MRLLPGAQRQIHELGIQEEDGGRDGPGNGGGDARVREFSHPGAVTGELHQRYYSERELKTENHLAENNEPGNLFFAGNCDHQNRGENRDGASDQAAQPRFQANIEKTFHYDLAGQRSGERGVLSGGEQSAGKECTGEAGAEYWTQQFVRAGDFRDVVQPASVKRGGGEDQDGGVDKQSDAESNVGIDVRKAQRFAFVADARAESAGLHNAGVQIEIMRHNRRAENSDGDVQHLAIAQNYGVRDEATRGVHPQRLRDENFVSEAAGDGGNQSDHERLNQAKPAALQRQDNQHVQRGDEHADEQRESEEQLQCDGRAQHLCEIARSDRNFASDPQKKRSAT